MNSLKYGTFFEQKYLNAQFSLNQKEKYQDPFLHNYHKIFKMFSLASFNVYYGMGH